MRENLVGVFEHWRSFSLAPAFGTTTATTASIQCGCGTPITATSETPSSR